VLPQRRNAGLTGSVAKVAAGALEHLPIARVVNLNRSLDTLKDEGYRVIGLAGEGTVSLEEADLEGPLVIVTGSEGDGLSLLSRRHCDQLVRIPLRGATPSLNASVATALLLYEVARRSWMKGLSGTSPAPRLVRPALPTPAPIDAPPSDPDAEQVFELAGAEGPAEDHFMEPLRAEPAAGEPSTGAEWSVEPVAAAPIGAAQDQEAPPAGAGECGAEEGALSPLWQDEVSPEPSQFQADIRL
jgi:23S rRNA (guanosine2251-2'-O)-methyltransferase